MSTLGLTKKQAQILRVIEESEKARGVAPSYDEIAVAVGLRSRSNVHRVVEILIERGYLMRVPGRARAIRLAPGPGQYSVSFGEGVRASLERHAEQLGVRPEAVIRDAVMAHLLTHEASPGRAAATELPIQERLVPRYSA